MQSNDFEYAGFWARVWATIIDTILLCIVTYPLLIWIYGLAYFDSDKTAFIAGPADFLISWVFPAIAVVLLWIKKQATPGKMAISSIIVDATTGNKATARQLIGRYFAYFISVYPLGLGMLWVAFDKRKQGWHDKIAGTVVIQKQYAGQSPAPYSSPAAGSESGEPCRSIKKEDQMKKVLIGLAILILAGTAAVVAVVSLAGRDRPAPDVADLAVERTELPAEDNAYTFFVSATNVFYWPANATVVADYLGGKTVDSAAVSDILYRNASVFEIIKRGIACKKYVGPEVTEYDTPLPHLSPWLKMGKFLAVRTRSCRLSGQYAEATESCVSLLLFGDMVQRDPEAPDLYLVGITIMNLGLSQAQELARDKNMPMAELTRLSAALAELSPSVLGMVRAIKVEYKVAANTIDQIHDGKYDTTELVGLSDDKPHPLLKGRRIRSYIFQPNATKETFANLCRNLIAEAPLPYAEMKRIDVEKAVGLKASRAEMLLRPNADGRILCAFQAIAVHRLCEHRCRTDCGVAATRIIVACHLYRNTRTRFPDNLEALVPEYLPRIPVDPYDGKPFRYIASKKVVYSVGMDLRDSGGTTNVPAPTAEDSPVKSSWKTDDVVYDIE